jgi:bifunctional DNA-binding transcriptional regulator/antitoxin component of YhaV-PrlF toxin-antitoxin module
MGAASPDHDERNRMSQTVETIVDDIHELPLPDEVRRRLGIVKGSKVRFVLDDSGVRILPIASSIDHLFGSVEPLPETSEDFDEEIEQALQDQADRRIRR